MPDAAGVVHPPASATAKIACLVPSITELLLDVGLGSQVVARTGYCIHPAHGVASIPKVGGTKDVNLAKLRSLAPDYVLVNIDENRRETAQALAQFVPHVVVTHPQTLHDNLALFGLVRYLFAASPGVVAATQALEARLAQQLQAAQAALVPPGQASLRALYLIWKDPWMTVGPATYAADALRCSGVYAVQPSAGGAEVVRYPAFAMEAVDWSACDIVLMSSEPYRFTQEHAQALQAELAPVAGRQVPVALVDGELFTWYGSRSLKTLDGAHERLATWRELCAPKVCKR